MLTKRPAAERGQFDYGWLKTAHTFSFNEYHDPRYHHFRTLRVINEDFVAPGQGFGEHGHRDMEIITLIQHGTIAHRDSLGHVETLSPGEVQCMTAGHGIRHSEFNPSATEPLHLYQIWIMPEAKGLTPGYQQQQFDTIAGQNQWQLLVSRDGASGSLKIHQDAQLWRTQLSPNQSLQYQLQTNRPCLDTITERSTSSTKHRRQYHT